MSAYLASLSEAPRSAILAELARQLKEKEAALARVAELEGRRDELQAANNRLLERARRAEGWSPAAMPRGQPIVMGVDLAAPQPSAINEDSAHG